MTLLSVSCILGVDTVEVDTVEVEVDMVEVEVVNQSNITKCKSSLLQKKISTLIKK